MCIVEVCVCCISVFFFFQAEDGIRDLVRSRGLGDVYKRQPAYRVEHDIHSVLSGLPLYIKHIIVVDDASPDSSADLIADSAKKDNRITLIRHSQNQGVGGAMVSGCLLYTSPSPRDRTRSRMPSSA